MALIRFAHEFDPVEALLALQRELDRAFERPSGLFDLGPSGRGLYPPMNVFSDRDGCVLKMEVPGIPSGNISIETQGRTLTVYGKCEARPPEKGSYHRRERGAGEFSRSLQLPADLDVEGAEASCKHGILTVRIPKREGAKPRQIAVHTA